MTPANDRQEKAREIGFDLARRVQLGDLDLYQLETRIAQAIETAVAESEARLKTAVAEALKAYEKKFMLYAEVKEDTADCHNKLAEHRNRIFESLCRERVAEERERCASIARYWAEQVDAHQASPNDVKDAVLRGESPDRSEREEKRGD